MVRLRRVAQAVGVPLARVAVQQLAAKLGPEWRPRLPPLLDGGQLGSPGAPPRQVRLRGGGCELWRRDHGGEVQLGLARVSSYVGGGQQRLRRSEGRGTRQILMRTG